MKKEDKISLEDLDEMTDEEAQDLTKEEKAELMKQAGKSGGKNKRQTKIDLSEKLGLSGPGREKQDIEYEVDERYDEGGVEDAPKPKFDYKRFFRKADGGAIGVESLFEERVPAAPSQLVEESDMILGYRGPGGYQGGRGSRGGGRSRGGGGGGRGRDRDFQQRGMSKANYSRSTQTQNFGGRGGPSGVTGTKTGPQTYTYNVKPTINKFQKGLFNQLNKLANLNKIAELEAEALSKTGLPSATGVISDARHLAAMNELSKSLSPFGGPIGEFIGDAGAFTAGLINEAPALGRGLGKKNLDAIKEDIVANFGVFSTPQTTTAEQIYASKGLKKGGRVGFNVGGITDPQALAIYNSMNAYGFSDQEIADAITAQGYDAGTLGQGPTIGKPIPVAPEPSEGIIGIDLQERGGGFNPFGPLQPTFTRPAGSDPSVSEDAFFGLGKFLQGKERGTLGTRLANQPKLPLPASMAAYSLSPFNPDSKNYNPDFVDQLNYLEGMDGLIGMSSVGLKYGPESVLFGKNVISGFGTNNYEKALRNFIAKTKNDKRRKEGEIELQTFLDAQEEKRKAEEQRQKDIQEAATRRTYSLQDLQDPSDRGTGQSYAAARARTASRVDSSGNVKAYGLKDGGLVSMFVEKR